jgi:hypothetical protein
MSYLYFFPGYVQEIYETFLSASKEDLTTAAAKLKEMCPPPMNTMLSKQSRSEAVKKRCERMQMTAQDFPPTIPGTNTLFSKSDPSSIKYKYF